MTAGEGSSEVDEDKKPRRPMNAVGLVTAEKVKNRAANAARTAFEAWQVRPRESPFRPQKADDAFQNFRRCYCSPEGLSHALPLRYASPVFCASES